MPRRKGRARDQVPKKRAKLLELLRMVRRYGLTSQVK